MEVSLYIPKELFNPALWLSVAAGWLIAWLILYGIPLAFRRLTKRTPGRVVRTAKSDNPQNDE